MPAVSVRDPRLIIATLVLAVILGLRINTLLTIVVAVLGALALYASRRVG